MTRKLTMAAFLVLLVACLGGSVNAGTPSLTPVPQYLQFRIDLQGRHTGAQCDNDRIVSVEFYVDTGGSCIYIRRYLSACGTATLGPWDAEGQQNFWVYAKPDGWLAQSGYGQFPGCQNCTGLFDFGSSALAGDIEPNNIVNVVDVQAFNNTMGLCYSDPGYNYRANYIWANLCINVQDWQVMSPNFGLGGPPQNHCGDVGANE